MILALAAFLPICANCQNDPIDRVVSRVRGGSGFSLVTPDIRDEVVRRIRASAGDSFTKAAGKSQRDHLLLVRLGDVEATKQVVEVVRASLPKWAPGSVPLLDSLRDRAQPVIIPLLAGDFSRNDGETQGWVNRDDLEYMVRPVSIEMCVLAFDVMRLNDAFAPETRAWAKYSREAADSAAPRQIRELMQQWWRDNEAHFLARDYHAVQPGPRLPARETRAISVDRPALPVEVVPMAAPVERTAPPGKFWWVVVVGGAIAVTALLFWKRHA